MGIERGKESGITRYSNLSKRDYDTKLGVESPVFREVETNAATRKPRSVNERRQGLRDCTTVNGRITHGGVPVPFTQGNPRAVVRVRDRADIIVDQTLRGGKSRFRSEPGYLLLLLYSVYPSQRLK
jgi:hypothetical protein